MEDLKDIVINEIKKLKFGKDIKLDIRRYEEVYPESEEQEDSYLIQIRIGSQKDDSTHDTTCSYLDFWYNPKEKVLDHINLRLIENLRNRDLGRGLVKSLEDIGKGLNCHKVKIYINTNKEFWNHMGYADRGDHWEKELNLNN